MSGKENQIDAATLAAIEELKVSFGVTTNKEVIQRALQMAREAVASADSVIVRRPKPDKPPQPN